MENPNAKSERVLACMQPALSRTPELILTSHEDKLNEDNLGSASNHNMERLIDAELTVLSIVKFLSAKDCLNLHTVSRKIHGILGKHDDALFGYLLRRDFAEGKVLLCVAKKRKLSRKKLYRAFVGRWSLPKQADENIRAASKDYEGDRLTKIMINDWVKPPDIPVDSYEGAKLLIPNDDVDNVVFIIRLGAGKDSFCSLMEWNSEYDREKRDLSQLIIDKSLRGQFYSINARCIG